MPIQYEYDRAISRDEFIDLLKRSTLAERRPIANVACIDAMLKHANLLCTAWYGEKLVGVERLIGQVDAMVREAGAAPDDFDAARWFARWMADPVPALGGVAPQELLDTADGREAVSTLLYQMKSGVYA